MVELLYPVNGGSIEPGKIKAVASSIRRSLKCPVDVISYHSLPESSREIGVRINCTGEGGLERAVRLVIEGVGIPRRVKSADEAGYATIGKVLVPRCYTLVKPILSIFGNYMSVIPSQMPMQQS